MSKKWTDNMTLDRMELYKAAKGAFEDHKPESFEHSLGVTVSIDELLKPFHKPRADGGYSDVRETRSSIDYHLAMLANALIVREIGPVSGEVRHANLRDEQIALDKIFGFPTEGFRAKDGISHEMQEISKAMSAAIKGNRQLQEEQAAAEALSPPGH